ncbi:MAG: ATP-dependent helicase [Bifidobacteriaceae bacterium]|jgi:DNA helicase-2/ATP-dependent DNA helicase PcrA|nr:ATP-dependent helicase [Bifidobacteriaceae bacterium]
MPENSAEYSAAFIARILELPRPTDEQIEVIEAPLSPALVVAGAGSGKTETMASRVVYLVANKLVRPDQILGLTFTRKAAAELADRMRIRLRRLRQAGLTGEDASFGLAQPTIATYNAYAATVVRDHGLRLGVDPDARLLSDGSRWQILEQLIGRWAPELETDSAPSTIVQAVAHLADQLTEHGLEPDEAAERIRAIAQTITSTPPAGRSKKLNKDLAAVAASLTTRAEIMQLVSAFAAIKTERGLLDYADQVALATRAVQADPAVGLSERSRFAAVLLDEYQDTSPGQERLLAGLFGGGHPVMAVGDPHQSIYGWRGASAAGMARFPTIFKPADAAPTPVLSLRVAWRNDLAILDAANAIAEPLTGQADGETPDSPRLKVAQLKPRPEAGTGQILHKFTETETDSAQVVAEFLAENWRDAPGQLTAAVLCRKRSQFAPIVEALRAAGIAHEVVGLGGLLAAPEIEDIVAFLTAAHDPGRGDVMMRLLTSPRLNLGIADLDVLARWARRLTAVIVGEKSDVGHDEQVTHSLVDAVDDPPPEDFTRRSGQTMTSPARQRLADLAKALRELRALAHLPVPEQVIAAERRLGLDIDLMARAGAPGRANVEAFVSVAHSFSVESDSASLGDFLEWLDFAQAHERGLDPAPAAPSAAAVQVLTVHGAKGLEWDVVAIPGLQAGTFPTTAVSSEDGTPTASAWLTDITELPWPLRADAADLPEFAYAADALPELGRAHRDFRVRAGEHDLAQERRLAYVALTRAKSKVLLTGSWWRSGTRPSPPSLFLAELVGLGLVEGPRLPDAPQNEQNPTVAQRVEATWPVGDRLGERRAELEAAADRVRDARGADRLDQIDSPLARLAELLLAEAAEASGPPQVALPERLTPSQIMQRVRSPERFDLDLRRPVPRRPLRAARTGTLFHEWVEGFFGAPAALGDEEEFLDTSDADVQASIAELREAFTRSWWARPDNGLTIHRTELDFAMPLGSGITPGRIDAVFRDAEGGYVIVDWKTGRPPSSDKDRQVADLQLRIYRRALAGLLGIDPAKVRAAFHYVPHTTGDSPHDKSIRWLDLPPSDDELAELHRLAG